jgi:hypothetical protein
MPAAFSPLPSLPLMVGGERLPVGFGRDVDVSATVVAETRISRSVLNNRIVALIGEYGEKIYIYGEMQGEYLLVRLKIPDDEVSAETIDMWDLLDSIDWDEQDPGVTKDIAVGVAYNLYKRRRFFGPKIDGEEVLNIDLDNIKVSYIDVSIGASEKIQPSIPALKIDVGWKIGHSSLPHCYALPRCRYATTAFASR